APGSAIPATRLFLETRLPKELAISARPSIKDANLDTPPAHRPAGSFFQVNVVPVVWRAIGTIQKSSANRCVGVPPRRRALICARRDELCRQPGRLPRVMERFAHKWSSQVPPG